MSEQLYTIRKVILGKNNKVELHYQENAGDGTGATKTKNYKCESNSVAHPDMILALEKCVPFVQQVFGFATVDGLEVKKMHITTHKKEKQIILTAQKKCDCGKVVAINTPLLDLGSDCYDFLDDLGVQVEEAEKEALEFLIRGKEAQLDMFDQDNVKPLNPDAVSEEAAAVV